MEITGIIALSACSLLWGAALLEFARTWREITRSHRRAKLLLRSMTAS